MFLYNKQIHPPTAVDHSIFCHFYSTREKNLVVTSNNVLKIYRIVRIIEADDDDESTTNQEGKDPSLPSSKIILEHRQTFSFFGAIAGITSITSSSNAPRDSIILCFPEAKISIVEYDPTTHDLRTVSMHYFEDEEMTERYTQGSSIPPVIRIDPEGRCAAFLVYGRSIVILPFRKEGSSSMIAAAEDADTIVSHHGHTVKSHILPSYRLPLNEEDPYGGERIQNIIDIEFLEGYNEPTLLILHEPIRTWTGRLAVRQDTVAMSTLSLNISSKLHPIIWSVNDLPYDSQKAVAVPKPVSGVLIFAANSLIYLNQSVPPYGVSLNGFNEGSTSFPLISQKGVKISLDASHCCFMSNDKLLVSLKGGELYVLTLFYEGMRSIRSFHFQKAASSVLTSCVTHCDEQFVFLGSRLGNSLLLQYKEKPYTEGEVIGGDVTVLNKSQAMEKSSDGLDAYEDDDENVGKSPPAKRIKGEEEQQQETNGEVPNEDNNDDIGDWVAKDIKLVSEDDLEVYGESPDEESEKLPTVFSFEVCDSIPNIAPCGRVCMGEPAILSEQLLEVEKDHHTQVELVTTSGFGKNGALSLIHRSIRPQLVTTHSIAQATDIWTVFDTTKSTQYHSYTIISRSDSTMIFETASEQINELDSSGFNSASPTILTTNVGNRRFIVQITPNSARLLDGSRQLQFLPLDFGSPVVFATSCDPYILLLTENGALIQLELLVESKKLKPPTKPKLHSSATPRITAICVYRDISGLFSTQESSDEIISVAPTQSVNEVETMEVTTEKSTVASSAPVTLDDEDELLYGESSVEDIIRYGGGPSGSQATSSQSQQTESEQKTGNKRTIPSISPKSLCTSPTFWLFLGRENGVLEIYSMPDYKLVYYVRNFNLQYKVLIDSGSGDSTGHHHQQPQDKEKDAIPILKELIMKSSGIHKSRPLLFARFDDSLIVYEPFRFFDRSPATRNHLKIRFRKLPESIVILRSLKMVKSENETSEQPELEPESEFEELMSRKRSWLIPFDDVASYTGIFLCGPRPTWFIMSNRGELRRHEQSIDGGVISFSPFDNVNCSKGFLYFNQLNDLRISQLPTQVTYDAPWPFRKIPLRCTVHFVVYHVPSKCYVVITSISETFQKLVKVNAGEDKDYEDLERLNDETYIPPMMDKFSIELFSPVSWASIDGTRVDFDEWEHVTCLRNISLTSEETESGYKSYVAIGTNYCFGEDVTSRGRIWIVDIIDVVPEPGMPLTRNRSKTIYCKEQKGPVSALCSVRGLLLSAIGQKLFLWNLKENDLVGVAFIDTQIYIHSAFSIKNLILVADIYKSISLLRYQEETRTLAFVSRETRSFEVYGCQFVIDSGQLAFVVSDAETNLIVYTYSPEMRESFGGTRLIRRADFGLGSNVMSFFRIRSKNLLGSSLRSLVPTTLSRHFNNQQQRLQQIQSSQQSQMTVYVTLDGSIGYLLPISEKTYRRLLMVQNVITTHVSHTAGLNPKSYRQYRSSRPILNPTTSRPIIDGDLIAKFTTLSLTEKLEIARKVGTSWSQIVDDLNEIHLITGHF